MDERPRWRRLAAVCGVAPLGVGAVVLFGWYLDVSTLIRVSPELPAMQAGAALGLVLAGLAVLAVLGGHAGASAILGATVAGIGALALAGFFFDLPVEFRTPGFLPPVDGGALRPQNMAPKSGLAFLITGCAITLLAAGLRARSGIPTVLALVCATAVALLAGEDLGKYGAEAFAGAGRTLKQMALHTAFAFLSLATAIGAGALERLRPARPPGARAALASALVVLGVAGIAAHGIRTGQAAGINRMTELAATGVAGRLNTGIEARRQAVSALAEQVGPARSDSTEWTAFAAALTGHVTGIVTVAWLDETGRVRWMAPERAGAPRHPALVIPRGTGGGAVVAGLDMEALLREVAPRSEAVALELNVAGVRIERLLERAAGDPVFEHRVPILLPGGARGVLSVRPTQALLNEARRPLPLATLLLGFAFAVVLALVVLLGATAQARATRLAFALQEAESAVRERKRAEAALARSEARLRESRKMEAVARLAGGVAHHFNNLLSVVTGYADLLLSPRDGDSPAVQRGWLEEIRTAAGRGGELTRNLLTMSARHVLHPRTVELRALVSGQSRGLGRLLGPGIQLRLRTETADSRVHIDPGPFSNALATLAANARDAMPDGGTLGLTLRERALLAGEAAALGVRPGAYVELEVADTGAGMDELRREKLFEPFAGADRPGASGGFGLAMLYGFVRQSGGAVEVESEPGRGSAFRILLPRADGRAATRAPMPVDRTAGDAPLILVAEDEDAVRRLAVRMLERAGFQTIAAADGEDALALVRGREHEIDLVLTDIVMPGVDGPELARRLWSVRPSLPVVFVSGYAAEDLPAADQVEARTAFVQKPFESGALIATARGLLDADAAVPLPG